MEIDRQKINQLAAMTQSEFSSLIYKAVLKAGGDRQQAQMAMSIAPMIQSKLKTASDEDLSKILKTVGEEKVRDIFDSLNA